MARYEFQAKTLEGKFVKGDLEATSESEARVIMRSQKLIPLKVAVKVDKAEAPKEGVMKFMKDKVGPKDLQLFTRQFSVLVGAGVPIVQSLEALSTGARNPGMARALRKVVGEVEKGKRLAEAMATRPGVFDRMYVNLVKAGEEGGVLDVVLNRLAEYIEKSVKLKGKITGALWYPSAIIVVAGLVIAGIMVFVIPNFVSMFSQMNKELPAMTRAVIGLSNIFKNYWYMIVAVVIAIPMAVRTFYDTENGRKILDEVMLKIPVFGSLMQRGAIARASRTLSTLLTAGVRIMEALDIAASTSGNWVIERAMIAAKESVSRGKSLAEPLQKQGIFPSMVVQMIAVGEQTGNLDKMLSKIADFYEDEVEAAAEALTSLVEPLLMVFLGGIIAVIVVAMYLPIFDLASVVGG